MPDPQPEVIIRDEQGVEHVFPPGFDPVVAGRIVRNQQAPRRLASAKTGGAASNDPNLAPDWGAMLEGVAQAFNPMAYARAAKAILTTSPAQTIPALAKGAVQPVVDILNAGTPDGHGSKAIGSLMGAALVGPVLRTTGNALRRAAPQAMDMGLQRTMADRLEFPNTPHRLVDEGIIPTEPNIRGALRATEQKVTDRAAAYDAAHPIGPVDPDTLAAKARDAAFTEGRVGGLGNTPGPESHELDALQQRYLAQNTRSRSLAETIDQKRAYQARASYASRPNAPTVTNNELNFNKGLAAANRETAIAMQPSLADDLAKEQDLIGALTAREKLDAKSMPLSTVGTLKSLLLLRNPTVMGGAGITLDRTGRAAQTLDPMAVRAALGQLMASHVSQPSENTQGRDRE